MEKSGDLKIFTGLLRIFPVGLREGYDFVIIMWYQGQKVTCFMPAKHEKSSSNRADFECFANYESIKCGVIRSWYYDIAFDDGEGQYGDKM